MYSFWRVDRLKEELRKRGASLKGKKADLVDRFNKKTDDGWMLCESRYLLVLRSIKQGDVTFLKGVCKASMKKLHYEVNCKLQMDGSVDETMCECTVGSGKEAHCKHVAVVLFAAEDMRRTKTMLTHLVCTQKLQSFHQPKKVFTASPLKADRLPSKKKTCIRSYFTPILLKQ